MDIALPPFVPLLVETLDSRAWKELSHGAKTLYVSLRRRVPNGRNRAYLSYRQARLEIKSSQRKIGEWFRELEHYGFIVLAQHGSLGVEGKGKAPHWRLTELGQTSRASADTLPEPPTRDFLRWGGTHFKKQNPDGKPTQPISQTLTKIDPSTMSDAELATIVRNGMQADDRPH